MSTTGQDWAPRGAAPSAAGRTPPAGRPAPRLGPPPPPDVALPPLPGAPSWRLLATAAAVGAVAAVLLVAPRPGLGVPLVALALTAATRTVRGYVLDRVGALLWTLAVGLTGVAAVRASGWLVALCLLAAAVVAALALTRARTWPGVVLALPAVLAVTGRAVPWAGRALRRRRPQGLAAYGRGAVLGLGAAAVVAGLLASSDPAYADLLGALLPSDPADLLLRVTVGVAAAAAVIGVGGALAAPLQWRAPRPGRRAAHRAEWVLPLALVALVLLLWVAVQAARLFGLEDPAATPAGDTYASRARLGFGQLVVVTLLVLALLTWAARRADDALDRPVFAALGGAHVVLAGVLVASALRRMWDYDQAYGLTVLRLVVAAGEVFLGLVLAGSALAWSMRRTRVLALAVPVAGAAWLLVLALAGPDALVARWDVDRALQPAHPGDVAGLRSADGTPVRTGRRIDRRIDVVYLAGLSDDAVPELARLPEPWRTCVFEARRPVPLDDPWYGWNLARSRAAAVPGVVTTREGDEGFSPPRPWASPCRS